MNEPEFGGNCAFAVSLKKGGEGVPKGDPTISVVVDDKTYLFSNPVARTLWKFTFAPRGRLGRWVVFLLVVTVLLWTVSTLLR